MLRILENCNKTLVIKALLDLIKEFLEKDCSQIIDLSVKCLLKTKQNLSEDINNIQIEQILLQIHLLLMGLQKNSNTRERIHYNNIIIGATKSIVDQLVNFKKEKILEEYSKSVKNHQLNDKYLLKWIKDALAKAEKK